MRRADCLLMFAILIGDQSAQAQDTFEARQGRAFAERVCSGCHGVVLGATSLAAGAPNFYTVAGRPACRRSHYAWLLRHLTIQCRI